MSDIEANFEEQILIFEEQIQKRVSVYGYEDINVKKLYEQLCRLLNQYSIVSLQDNQLDKCYTLLKKAEIICNQVPEQKVQTYNHLACYFRKVGKTRTALKYLQQALQIELALNQSQNLPNTYLNLCAVLSQLDRHEDAIQHIYLSIIMLQHEILMKTLSILNIKEEVRQFQDLSIKYINQSNEFKSRESISENKLNKKQLQNKVAVLVVAYHNLGVEMEYLSKNLEANKIFQSALLMAEQNLPDSHKMTHTLKKLNEKFNKQASELQQQKNLPKVYITTNNNIRASNGTPRTNSNTTTHRQYSKSLAGKAKTLAVNRSGVQADVNRNRQHSVPHNEFQRQIEDN
ncbi:hypothetical protein pb186bvf_000201 [Paramecium bursaria]